MNIIKILFNAILGEFIKLYYRIFGFNQAFYLSELSSSPVRERVILSLTSYGRRVYDTLPYALISLLRQTYRPDAIIVWLDSDEWDEKTLPPQIRQLQARGVMIKYCDNLRSYKKLIPALLEYPNDLIVTFDDDLFYHKSVLKRLIDAHIANPNMIIASRAHKILFDRFGHMLPYSEWTHDIDNISGDFLLPLGGEGVVYKYGLLYKDVCKRELFSLLAPNADDVWFFFMSYLNGTSKIVVNNDGNTSIPIDLIYQFFHRNSALMWTNCRDGQNDNQISSIMKYYNINMKNNK